MVSKLVIFVTVSVVAVFGETAMFGDELIRAVRELNQFFPINLKHESIRYDVSFMPKFHVIRRVIGHTHTHTHTHTHSHHTGTL